MTRLRFSDEHNAWMDRYGITWSFDPLGNVWEKEEAPANDDEGFEALTDEE